MTTTQVGRIFISYRRDDSAGYAGRIYDRLATHFGKDALFMDVDTIQAGLDFVEVLENAVQSCDVLVALIGRQWLSIKDSAGKRRLDNPEDFVRIEVATALKRGIRVIPVLVDGTPMPNSDKLPSNLVSLARRNAVLVSHYSFHNDASRLIEQLELALESAEDSKIRKANEIKDREARIKHQAEIENLLSQADIALNLQDWELAKEKLDAVLKLESGHGQAQVKLAIVERKLREAKEKVAREKADRESAKKAEEERQAKARIEAERLAALKAEEERLAHEKAESERKAKEAAEKLRHAQAEREAAQKAEGEAMQPAARKSADRKAKEEVDLNTNNPPPAGWQRPSTLGIVFIAVIVCGFAALNYLPGILGGATATAEYVAAEPLVTEPASAPGIAREDTVVLGWSIHSPIGVTNPWATGYTHQEGNAFMWEPLMYFAIFADKEIPWLADSMEYTKDDFTELTIKLNQDAAWSDGTPVTSRDVAFTFEGQLANDKLPYHASFEQFVDNVATPDDYTVVVTFKIPAPRFAFEVLMLKFDTGIPIVPAHVLENEADVNAFAGGLDIVHSGPYNLVLWDANQKIFELREDWWAVKAGRIAIPQVKRIVITNTGSENTDSVIPRLINNEFDAILDLPSGPVKQALDSNDKITTYTGNEPPYGYIDWWPNSLWMNTQIEPFSDVRVRRAISLAIDRDTIDQIIYDGAKVTTIYPFPLYPGLQKFADSPAVKALEEQYQPRKFDLDQSAELMYEAGFTIDGDGLWEKGGATVPTVINGFESIHADIVTILVEMLRVGGFDASINFGSDAYTNMIDGQPGLYMFGHGASLKDPYAAFELFRDPSLVCTTACYNRFSRYSNPEYDAILDQMAPLSSNDPLFQDLAVQALGIYWRDQIDIPIIEWLHRIPYNQTYWTNWPTAGNPAMGTSGAFWHHTGLLVITSLEKAK